MALTFSSSFFLLDFIATQSIILCIASTTSSTGFTIPLIPPFSTESPFYQENLTEDQQLFNQLVISQTHDYYLNSSPNNIMRRVTRIPPFLFSIKILLGTPEWTEILVLDTGSDITWTQCKQCFNQTPIPIFNPNHSSSYHKLPCGPQCAPPYKCVAGECTYSVTYGGGASTTGPVSIENFTFGRQQYKMVFGCGTDNRNFSFEGRGASGIVGLSNFRHSLVNQLLKPKYRLFSYCLTIKLNKTSLMKFGSDAVIRGSGVRTLPFVRQNISPNYYLSLIDISVGTKRLGFRPGTFQLRRDGSGGIFIDSGAAGSALEEGPYNVVMSEFDRYFNSQGLRRLPVERGLEYCYKYDPHFNGYIGMTFHFERSVDFVVDAPNMYIIRPEKPCFCVVLAKSKRGSGGIIGACQQVNKRIVYDMTHQMLHFKSDDCAKDDH